MPKPRARSKQPATNRVRLIGGSHGGRWIRFPDADGLRPSADRVRETLFNWLQPQIEGAACLDLFAGSGAIGFEAASRRAGRVVMVERDPKVVAALRQSQQMLALDVEIVRADALSWLAACNSRFDLVFLDPPFAERLLSSVFPLLIGRGMLNPGASIYFEMDGAEPLAALPGGLELARDKRAGQVHYGLLRTNPIISMDAE